MLDRVSCERRVYRLAVMLTGNPTAATRVISEVVNSQPDLSTLDSAHMAAADCVVVLTDHKAFDFDLVVNSSKLVVDTRNATKVRAPHVLRLGAPGTGTTAPV